MINCNFCGKDCDATLVLRDTEIFKKDGSDIILCSDCLNNYSNGDYDKITLREDVKDILVLKGD